MQIRCVLKIPLHFFKGKTENKGVEEVTLGFKNI